MERFRASVEARRRGEEPPEDGYQGDYVAELAKLPEDPVPARDAGRRIEDLDARSGFRIHFDSWAKQSELEQRLPEFLPRLDTYEKDGAVWARSSAYGDEDDRVLIRSEGGTPTYRAADVVYLADKLDRGLDRAHLRPRRRPPRDAQLVRGGRAHARLRPRAGRGAALPARAPDQGRRAGEDVEAARRRRLPRRLHRRGRSRRGALVSRLARARTRRSRSTSTSPPRRAPQNPVYYVQYAHARIAGILRNAEGAAPSAEPPAELAAEERDLIKRLAEFPAVVAEATERRGPHAIPTYAIRVADDFHRFYHHHKVLGSEAEAFRLGLVTATKSVIARCARLDRRRSTRHDVAMLKVEIILGIVASSIAILAFLARAIANVRQGRRAREGRGRNRARRREISPPE